MSHNYVSTSAMEPFAEEMQEDAELIEAVEAMVGVAAVSVKDQIVHELQSLWEPVQSFSEYVFPILVVYQQDPYAVWIDLEHVCVFLLVFAVAFVVLAPPRRQQRRPGGTNTTKGHAAAPLLLTGAAAAAANGGILTSKQLLNQQHRRRRSFAGKSNNFRTDSDSNDQDEDEDELCMGGGGSLNTLAARHLLMEDETDEDRFARVYPSLQAESKYANLILPPECKLIEKPKAIELRNQQQKQQKAAAKRASKRASKRRRKKQEKSTLDFADDPIERLHTYFRHFMVLVRSLFTYDWAGAMWTILLWMQGIIKHRRINSRTNMAQQQDDEMDMVASTDGPDGDLRRNQSDDADSHDGADTIDTLDDTASLKQNTNDEKEENRTSLTAPVSPFATPVAETIIVRTAQVGPHTPRVPLLESSPNHIKTFREEEKRDSHTPRQHNALETRPLLKQRASPQNNMQPDENEAVHQNILQHMGRMQRNEKETVSGNSDWEDLPVIDNTPSVEFVSARMTAPTPTGETIITSNVRKANQEEEGDGDSDTLPETPRSQLSADEEASETEAKLRSTWYFFETAHSKESLKRMSLAVPVPDKNGYVLGDEYLPDDRCTPLLVFVNSRSGPRQGHFLITQLRRLLNPIQIWDLADGGPEEVLESFCALTKLRILVCGGDGTVSWIISALDSLKLTRKWPPIAILPLGTGNDLARFHGWGAGYNNESIITILEQISESYISVLDRWELTIEQGKKKRVTTKNFLNYFSIGVDAEAALQVHNLRERRPDWFFSRLFNKAWYGFFGAEQHIKGNGVNIQREITLHADGVLLPLPASSQGIIVMNIDSYAGGIPLWSYGVKTKETKRCPPLRRSRSMGGIGATAKSLPLTSLNSMGSRIDSNDELAAIPLTEEELYKKITACDSPASCQDGYLEIVSIRGYAHLGQCTLGVGNAERVGQCRELKIVIKTKVPVQIDGEPWRQDRCVLRIRRKHEPALMLHRSADDGGIETEMSKLLEWAEERNLIDSQVHSVLMKEFSRRIESKTRQRRVRTLERGVVQHLKRAMASTGAMSNMATAAYINGSPSNDEEDIRRSRSTHNMAATTRQMNNSGPIAF